MRRYLLLILLVLVFLNFWWIGAKKFNLSAKISALSIKSISPKIATDSAFTRAIAEEDKKRAEDLKKEEEEKKQTEEWRKYAAAYGPCRSIPILMYHHIDDKPGWLYVKKDIFAQQMDYLSKNGYTIVGLEEIVQGLRGEKTLPAKSIALTFDDGYRDFFNNAYPILRQKGFRAVVFLISQLMDGADFLTWEQAREMVGSGLVALGDHTMTHRALASLKEEDARAEIIKAREIIREKTKAEVNLFAYPFGSYNSKMEEILQSGGGFAAAVTTQALPSCAQLPYRLSRIRIGNAGLKNYGL